MITFYEPSWTKVTKVIVVIKLKKLANQNFFFEKEAFKNGGLFFDVGVIIRCLCEDLGQASVRDPSRSSGHLSVSVQ